MTKERRFLVSLQSEALEVHVDATNPTEAVRLVRDALEGIGFLDTGLAKDCHVHEILDGPRLFEAGITSKAGAPATAARHVKPGWPYI